MKHQLRPARATDLLLWLLQKRRRFRIAGNSMLPLLSPGDEVLIDPAAYHATPPQAGDLVIAQHPLQPDVRLVKRIESVIPGPQYVLKGDNPTESTDSRMFGTVSAQHIIGKVVCRFG